jgi:lipoyl(octanoyl) transferase
MANLLDLGRRPYREVWALQREIHARVAAGIDPDTWIVVEHEPVITLGRNAKRAHVLRQAGIDVVEIERGGDVTYHGLGQLVVYPIVKLPRFREIVPLVRALEETVIETLAGFGIAAGGRPEHRGVYVGDDAICAIGLAVQKMTSLHGIALNVNVSLDYDALIVPCGTPEYGITSISEQLGRDVTWAQARDAFLPVAAQRFGISFELAATPPLLAASNY